MKFAELHEEFLRLRQSLRIFVDEGALDEISVETPGADDEASFLRLIAWSYVLVFEAGRITIPYLLKLPSGVNRPRADLQATCDLVHDLRTWCFHNLSFGNKRGLKISRRATLWFIGNCGASSPSDLGGWRSCYECLCADVYAVVAHCKSAVEVMVADPEARERTIDDLKLRLDRNWPAYRFDEFVNDAVIRMGQKLDVPKFRQGRLAKWREYLEAIPEDDDPAALILRLIERDVLDYFGTVLPIDSNDVMSFLSLGPGPEIAELMYVARQLYGSGVTDRDQLLARLLEEDHRRRNVADLENT